MALYTERHGMRQPIEKTYDISIKAYGLLFDCCARYWEYLAWKYPDECPDGRGCCGLDWKKFSDDMEYEIPTLFRLDGMIDKPRMIKNVFEEDPVCDEYDQYALLDLIEYVSFNVKDITERKYHSYFGHDDISFGNTNRIAREFIDEINTVFEKTGLLYHLTNDFIIERIEEVAVLSSDIEEKVLAIQEQGLRELLQMAIIKHKSPYPDDQKDAVEKIWDAFERLKTYYTFLNKKDSADKIIQDMSNDTSEYKELFKDEFMKLTQIGNDFRIRHHETYKIDIPDIRYYDYFFNRCLSLIAIAIRFLT